MADEPATTAAPETKKCEVDMDAGLPHPEQFGGDPRNLMVTWNNRRQMAWWSMFSINILVAVSLFVLPTDKALALQDIITTAMWVFLSVVAAYLGFTSLPFWGFGKGGK